MRAERDQSRVSVNVGSLTPRQRGKGIAMMIGVRCGSVILACSPESIHVDALAQIRQAELLAEYLRASDGGLANRHDAPPAHTNARSAIAGQGDGGK